MHEVEVKHLLSPGNGMNIYRGCSHGCIYCDARSECYQILHPFEDIEIKKNAVTLLETELKKKRRKGMVGTGGMSDPYLHLEETYELTRKCLELIYEYEFGIAIQTKSNRILRDLDLLKRIDQKTKTIVSITLTTIDDDLCRIIEPNVSCTSERIKVLEILKDAGIPTVVWMTPILPFINDTKENIQGILDACIKAKVKGILFFDIGLTLRDGNRHYYYQKLDQYFPGLKQRYINYYGNQYNLPSPHRDELYEMTVQACREHGILCEPEEIFNYLQTYENKRNGEQLRLF